MDEIVTAKLFEQEEQKRLLDALRKTRRERSEAPLPQPRHLMAQIIVTDAELNQDAHRGRS